MSRAGETYYIAAFNITSNNKTVNGSICISDADIPEGDKADRYFVVEQFTGKTYVVGKDEKLPLSLLHNDEFRLYKFIPVKEGFALCGLSEKFISTLTAKNVTSTAFTLAEGGDFIFYSDTKPSSVKLNGKEAKTIFDGTSYKVKYGEERSEVTVVITY